MDTPQPCQNCTPAPNKLINVDQNNMCVSCGKLVKIKYKPEYLEIAKNSKSLVELSQKIGVEIKTILAWANKKKKDAQGNKTEELARPEFMLIVSQLFQEKPEEKPKDVGGRPSKWDERFIDAEPYLQTCGRENTKLPTVEGYAIFLDVHRDTLYEWAKLYPKFSDTLKKIEILQKEQLINDGIYGGKEVNATIVKLLLQNNHGMKERVDNTSNDKELKQLVGFNYLTPHDSNNSDNQTDI